MILNIERLQSKYRKYLAISYINENGGIDFLEIPIDDSEMYNYSVSSKKSKNTDPDFKDMFGRCVKRDYISSINDLSYYRVIQIVESQPDDIKNKLFGHYIPKIYFIDIETDSKDGFPDPDVADKEVLSISISYGNNVVVMGLKDLNKNEVLDVGNRINEYTKSKENIKFHYIKFNSEYEMLTTFFYKFIQKMEVISGWNVLKYDWKYLINRSSKLDIDYHKSSPSLKMVSSDKIPMHRLVVDYMDVFKKYDRSVPVKESLSLDFISDVVLGIKKIKYKGALSGLYDNDFKNFILYNAIDSRLVQMIHEKLKVIEIHFSIANSTGVECYRTFSAIKLIENLLVRYFLERKMVIIDDKNRFDRKNDSNDVIKGYKGAFVFEVKQGVYNWVSTLDFSSLYPTIMRQFNISIENFVNRYPESEVKELLKDENFKDIVTSSGSVFKRDDSVTKQILTDFYSKRKKLKDEVKQIDKKISDLKNILKKYE